MTNFENKPFRAGQTETSDHVATHESVETLRTPEELESLINSLEENRLSTNTKRDELQKALAALLHQYKNAGADMSSYTEARQAIESKIQPPTFTDKLRERFLPLLGYDVTLVRETADFLEQMPLDAASQEYRMAGSSLRGSVGELSDVKERINQLIGKELVFRGGTMEGEEQSPRDESIDEVARTITALEAKIKNIDTEIALKREEALEAWQAVATAKEAEALRLSAVSAEKSARQEILAEPMRLLEELLHTSPSDDEVCEVISSTAFPEIRQRAKEFLFEKYDNQDDKKNALNKLLNVFREIGYELADFEVYKKVFLDYFRMDEEKTSGIFVQQLCEFQSHPEVIDFLISKMPFGTCTYMGNGYDCKHGGCCMVSNYFGLPVEIQEKIVGRFPEFKSLFAQIELKKIEDPLARAEFILGLGFSNLRRDRLETSADSIGSTERYEASVAYVDSGKRDLRLLQVAIRSLKKSNKGKELIKGILDSIHTKDEMLALYPEISDALYEVGSVNEDLIHEYLDSYKLRSKNTLEAAEEYGRKIHEIRVETQFIFGKMGEQLEKVTDAFFKKELDRVRTEEEAGKNQ